MGASMKPFSCSRCRVLQEDDCDDIVFCGAGIDPRPKHRGESDEELCKEMFKPIEKPWHEKFYWER